MASYALTELVAGARITKAVRKFIRRTTQPIAWVLTLAFTVVLAVTCATGREMTQAEKDCCAAMGFECHRGVEQHDCCSTESQRVDPFATAQRISLSAPVAVITLLAFVPDAYDRPGVWHAVQVDQTSLKQPRVPTYLLVSTLLI